MPSHGGDTAGARLGMWLFLLTEILLFGGLFILYTAYVRKYPLEFHRGGSELSLFFGSANTIVLLTSSLCIALAVMFLQRNEVRKCLYNLNFTLILGLTFLANKFFEWSDKFSHGIFPNSPKLLSGPQGENIFYVMYFFMTGLHGLHVLVGVVLIAVVAILIRKKRVHQRNSIILFNAALYWHLVDVIWIYLFPLFYLIT
ncbi:MAG TPA: cytochrome c oxidase subunit 3 family protein [Thermodesulfobacteriota bacterium]|nr:cytochrome c oxidase subunit 3 family protein [Deltaproteobacteria bacterium]HNR12170.1 cytochrome c oxidase subunit 3 family protein [Thermodesulfobacteriota bacterium]HNU72818.1 cytochrome c oxidase subunit 3 family protein [Thermodesulfobacteriota bacterium]HOC38164.1 cytochrome c oxidase subunit 3 family protein [Thermodesulfobacteriota bacterium]HQO78182.1 cytochrome c oxidase subunit 3 family protein [Thermodesulfobacteriota bacterium]